MMTPGEKVLLRLEARACWPGARVPRVRLEPLAVRGGGSDFGTIAGQQTVAELQDLVNLWTTRMAQLTQAYADFSPTWVARDTAGYEDWTNDWVKLQSRYQTALSAANAAILAAKVAVFVPNNTIPAQGQYDGLAKAMTACYPPDGCPQAKGDWGDLYDRITAAQKAAGAPVLVDKPPQPVATDVDLQAFAATAPLDVVAQATGLQKGGPLPPGSPVLGFLKWLQTHQTAVEVGAVVIAAGLVVALVLPTIALPLKAAKVAAAAL